MSSIDVGDNRTHQTRCAITHDQSPLASAFDLPGKLSLSVTEANVALIATELRETITTAAGAHARLKMDALEDLLVTVHYVAG